MLTEDIVDNAVSFIIYVYVYQIATRESLYFSITGTETNEYLLDV